jgi:tRNA threonylcarbamoyl adenosine modification protein (Sua5/YciO/YrdC/YwlC family)
MRFFAIFLYMIEYVVPGNIDDRILSKSARLLREGGLIALPTDTSWSIACSLRSRDGIKKLKAISRDRDEQHFTLLCSDISQCGELCSMDNSRFRLINRLTPGPYVFILKTLLNTEKALSLRRKEIGIRIPDSPIPVALIKTLEHPLYSITAKRSMLYDTQDLPGVGETDDAEPEALLFDGGWEVDGINGIDLTLDNGEEQARLFSTVLDISGDDVSLLRSGAGAWPL